MSRGEGSDPTRSAWRLQRPSSGSWNPPWDHCSVVVIGLFLQNYFKRTPEPGAWVILDGPRTARGLGRATAMTFAAFSAQVPRLQKSQFARRLFRASFGRGWLP